MNIEQILAPKKKAILKKWFHLVLENYPEETARFITKEKDPFANPVGSAIWEGIEGLFDELIKGPDKSRVSGFLDRMMRVRAIQDFTPSQAVGFIFRLKDVIRQEVGKDSRDGKTAAELLAFDSKIDTLALIAFDVYMKCREQVYDLKTNEIKNRYSRLLQRAGLLYELPEHEPDGENTTGDNVI
jgi:hypothetical protein